MSPKKVSRRRKGEKGASDSATFVRKLPAAIVGRLWPPERLIAGLRTCKALRIDLLRYICRVELVKKEATQLRSEELKADFRRALRAAFVTLDWCEETNKLVKAALDSHLHEGLTRLRVRAVGDIGIKKLAELIKKCSVLERLELPDNEIRRDGARAISNSLQYCSSLLHVDLNGNSMCAEGSSEGLRRIVEALRAQSALTSLCLGGNELGTDGAAIVSSALHGWGQLAVLDLQGNWLLPEGAEHLGGQLRGCTALRQLVLRNNLLQTQGARRLAEGLGGCTALTHLDLRFNLIGDSVEGTEPHTETEPLLSALERCHALEHLDYAFNLLQPHGAALLARRLPAAWPALACLNLSHNRIGPHGMASLVQALPLCSTLSTLRVGGNELHDTGATQLAEGLAGLAGLLELGAEDNEIGTDGVRSLANALAPSAGVGTNQGLPVATRFNLKLRVLDLAGNMVGDDGARHLSDVLRGCTALTQLKLGRNRIGRRGRRALAAAQSRSTLTDLDLSHNTPG